ncbi:hypothetical protein I4U23_005542 [Adineta vaga]|nr:hypothetical protein I4U23_005542 [Adineta vaga]
MKYSTNIYWSDLFNLIFMEDLKKNFYLLANQNNVFDKIKLIKQVQLTDRCPHINELFNQTIVQYYLLRRMKYYHLLCQNVKLNISCFYDDIHLCLCYYYYNGQRLSNCFQFNHTMKGSCSRENECANDGQCFQIGSNCLKKSTCLCHSCFYGERCQFNTNGHSLSIDTILAYHIQPLISLFNQSNIIKITLILITKESQQQSNIQQKRNFKDFSNFIPMQYGTTFTYYNTTDSYPNDIFIDTNTGTGTAGSTPDMLDEPRSIFLDTNSDLYVADRNNHRVQPILLG